MKVLKRSMPLAVLGLSFATFYFLVMNVQIFYGGYEGLLYHGFSELIEAETMAIRAEIVMAPEGENLSEVMDMTFVAEGSINRQDRSSLIKIGLLNGSSLDPAPIAKIIQDGDSLLLIPEGEEAEPIDLGSFIAGESEAEPFDEEDWDKVYQTLVISEVTEVDPRPGKGYLEGTFINYELDLVTLLADDQRTMIEEILGEGILKKGLVIADIQMDTSGELAAIRIHLDAGIFTADGWVTLDEHSH